MQFSPELRERVATGEVTVSVRRWQRPQVKAGGRYRVAGATIEITAIELMPFASLTDADVRLSGEPDREVLRARAAHSGPIHDDTLVYRVEFHVLD